MSRQTFNVHGVLINRAQHDLTRRLSGHTVMPSMSKANHIMMRKLIQHTYPAVVGKRQEVPNVRNTNLEGRIRTTVNH